MTPRSDVARSCILPELMELSCDEECQVRCAAMEAVADISSLLLSAEKEVGEILRLSIAPLVRKFCERSLADGDKAVLVAARLLGRLCHLLKGVGYVHKLQCNLQCECLRKQKPWTIIRRFYRNQDDFLRSFYSTVEGATELQFASFCTS